MKQSKFTGLLFCAAIAFFLISCGGGATKKTAAMDSSATVSAPPSATTAAPVTNTIVTTPQNMMIVTHKVANFTKWLASYDAHDSLRLASGIHNYVIGRSMQDSNTVMVAVKIDDVAKAKAFSKGPGLKQAMQKSGVIGAPSISIITAVWQDTVVIPSKMRSRTTFAVKDWDAWQKAFEEGKQERIDNGITVRVISHDAHDNKKVSLVTAITDSAKAFAYYKSDALKKRRAASGVIGEPVRFLFDIVKRY
ncbi:hypothetical protein QWZ08_07160 [Ferruginibacter paludis]|uniref:hypothetical protein n=1 Tax=Ferruginibacter paludis TaxID=1310417 RepID=UPI0025B4E0CB|nr:hypothetical protein [Ferruginibacter paludis]MDN3655396.1 hypothetical protein [Ferruginibacter paludis]